MIYVVTAIIVVLLVIALIIFLNYLKLKEFDENCDIANDNIEDLLKAKKEILEQLVEIFNDEKINMLYGEYKDDSDLFEREDILFNVGWEINKLFNNLDKKELKKLDNKNVVSLISDIINIEEDLQGLREYYNRNALNYNERYNKRPFTIIYNLLKFKAKKSFKLRTLEEYEILKN